MVRKRKISLIVMDLGERFAVVQVAVSKIFYAFACCMLVSSYFILVFQERIRPLKVIIRIVFDLIFVLGKSQNRNDCLDFFLSVARLGLGFGPSKG